MAEAGGTLYGAARDATPQLPPKVLSPPERWARARHGRVNPASCGAGAFTHGAPSPMPCCYLPLDMPLHAGGPARHPQVAELGVEQGGREPPQVPWRRAVCCGAGESGCPDCCTAQQSPKYMCSPPRASPRPSVTAEWVTRLGGRSKLNPSCPVLSCPSCPIPIPIPMPIPTHSLGRHRRQPRDVD